MEKFLNEGITYNADDFYVHANTADFEEEVINKISEPANIKRRSPKPPALLPSMTFT